MALLEEANGLFRDYEHFSDMPDSDRKKIAGYFGTKPIDWGYFGGMRGHGYFKEAIGKSSPIISSALDEIPLEGAVTKRDFDRYCSHFTRAFKNVGTATATRLLAMKRPDFFVCVAQKNEKKLCAAFGIAQKVPLSEYWDRVVARITDSNWWDSDKPTDPKERSVWHGRAAFLDVVFYEPINK